MLPIEVLEEAQKEFLDFQGTGMSVTEISHRDKAFAPIVEEAEALMRELMNIPDDYCVIFVQGGASQQFAAVPLNLMHTGKADYIVTGNFSKKAWQEGQIYGEARKVASSEDKNYTYIPDVDKIAFNDDSDYVHICSNNTIFGTRYIKFPETKKPLVCDMSSEILSREIDVTKFGVIYAGAQKNLAPAGVTIVIARKDLIENPLPVCPTMLKWKTQADNGSLYNTPPCFSIYMANLVLRHLKKLGGIKEINKVNEYKAGLLYDFIDNSKLYTNSVEKKIPFHHERALRYRLQRARRKVRKRSEGGGVGFHKRTSPCRRYARFHLQRNARRRRESAHRVHEEIRKGKRLI